MLSSAIDSRPDFASETRSESITLSILIPVYNEAEFVGAVLKQVMDAELPLNVQRQIIIVDDASTDESQEIIEDFAQKHKGLIQFIRHSHNQGKGAAIRTALAAARGELAIVQDADLEYNPKEYPRLLAPLLDDRADVVYGSRFLVAGERRVLYFWHALANWFLTNLCNVVSDLNLTDMETCYKAFRVPLVKSIPLRCNRFGFEPELTIKLARRQARIYETPISYAGRTYEEGKKIGLWDAIKAVLVILRFSLFSDSYKEPGAKILDAFAEAPRFNR